MFVTYGLWALVLVSQNFAFTMVSRARNSNSVMYHAVCSLFSNGIWFVQNLLLLGNMLTAFQSGDVPKMVFIGVFYTVFTMLGSLSAHWFALQVAEKRLKS